MGGERGKHRLGKCDSNQARAKQDKTGDGHRKETVRSEFITHGTPIARPCSNRTTVMLHSQKDFLFETAVSIRVMISCNTRSNGHYLFGKWTQPWTQTLKY
jgi:hypothetical protein